ncbi:hypothetical protein CC78DRAFT_587857 [Lojkania enalia]|uniref:Uncharacterized protein n=1 Tax=Lojkania enalia TaxID=147567 RepID=A0A9P4JWT6_9PLEO|nr:hypothetical protein CC78DRAFT_587857 [Didymosphaeria enalia]
MPIHRSVTAVATRADYIASRRAQHQHRRPTCGKKELPWWLLTGQSSRGVRHHQGRVARSWQPNPNIDTVLSGLLSPGTDTPVLGKGRVLAVAVPHHPEAVHDEDAAHHRQVPPPMDPTTGARSRSSSSSRPGLSILFNSGGVVSSSLVCSLCNFSLASRSPHFRLHSSPKYIYCLLPVNTSLAAVYQTLSPLPWGSLPDLYSTTISRTSDIISGAYIATATTRSTTAWSSETSTALIEEVEVGKQFIIGTLIST